MWETSGSCVCSLYCEAFLGCIRQSGNVWTSCAHLRVCGECGESVWSIVQCGERERDSAAPAAAAAAERAGQVTRAKDSPPSSPHQPHPASRRGSSNHLPLAPAGLLLPQVSSSVGLLSRQEAEKQCLGFVPWVKQATLARWRPQRQHSWAVASSPRPGQPCQQRT